MDPGPNDPWSLTITIPPDSLDTLHYYFYAIDNSSNVAISETVEVAVTDNDAPVFGTDRTDVVTEPDGLLEFSVEVDDNIEVVDAWVEYWYGDGPPTRLELSLGGSVWTALIIVDRTLEDLHYRFGSTDGFDNVNMTEDGTVGMVDSQSPFIDVDRTPERGTTGDPFEFNVTAGDNLGIRRVTVRYTFGDGELKSVVMEVVANLSHGRAILTHTITLPSGSTDPMTYNFSVEDLVGNILDSEDRTVLVVDDDPPEIVHDGVSEAVKGLRLRLTVDASDNIGLAWVIVLLRYGSGICVSFRVRSSLMATKRG